MKIKFRRIISNGSFIPQIDGLRFIAVAGIVLYHLNGFLSEKDLTNYVNETPDGFNFLKTIISHGAIGVPLFFVISGFILARPFARMYLNKGPKVNIKNYFMRRLTRLEPPYLIVMTVLLFASVYVVHKISLENGFYSWLASITYTHNFFYGKSTLPLLNGVAWSLEIEIQFYILMPVLALFFTINNEIKRRTVIIILCVFFIILDYFESLPFRSIINYIEYFLVGILLADLYVSKSRESLKTKVNTIVSVFLLIIILSFDLKDFSSTSSRILWEIFQLGSIFILYYLVIFHNSIKFLANPIITNIGGMCYTIYLLHYQLISMFGNPLMKLTFSNNSIINTAIYYFILISFVMICSSIFFLTIERPCMDKDWYKKLFKRNDKTINTAKIK